MFKTAWNRAFLIASGFALGWTAVSYLTVPQKQMRSLKVEMFLSLAAGLFIIILLGINSPQAAASSTFVFAFSALIAYAGNAKQASKVQGSQPKRLTVPASGNDRTAILLVSVGEDSRYIGPESWARRFSQQEAEGNCVPHWFIRPFVYARIRAAYDAMGKDNLSNSMIVQMAQELDESLGRDYGVQVAHSATAPYFLDMLIKLASEGFPKVVVVPLTLSLYNSGRLREQVNLSRVRETGTTIEYVFATDTTKWPLSLNEKDRLQTLADGVPPEMSQEVDSELIKSLQEQILGARAPQTRSRNE